MKVCNTCREEKPLSEFHRSKQRRDGHKGDCKGCRSEMAKLDYKKSGPHWRARYERQREFMNSLKQKPCADCGIEYHPAVMHFHHLRDKTIEVGNLFNKSQEKILAEVEKCVVLCANYHIMRHVNEREPAFLGI